MGKKLLILCAAGLVGTSTAFAAETSADVDDDNIVVYGTRLEQMQTEVGSSVSVITADEIDALNVGFALDAIATAPGVTINQNGAFGGAATVRIRGALSEQTLVIVDGVAVNDPTSPGGGYDFSRFDPLNIERIEILKGPQSTLWGTDAMGGVVNIVTKRPQEGFSGQAFAQAGSYNSLRGGAVVSAATPEFDYRLAFSTHDTDGISKADEANGNTEKDGFNSSTLSASSGLNFGDGARLQAMLLWTDGEAEFDGFSFGAEGNVGDSDEVSKTEELSGNVTLQLPLFDGKLDNLLLVGITDIDRESFADGASSFASEGERLTYRYQGTLTVNEQNRLAFGVEREENDSNGDKTSIDGIFGLYELRPTDTVTLSAGVRRDDHERYGGETTGRLAAAWNPTDQVTLSASWGEGFKAPTLFQTTFFCCGAAQPNPDLRPERSEAYDVGLTLRTADLSGEVGITWFDQDTTDLIDFSFALGGYENIAIATSRGVELDAAYRFNEIFSASLSYANIDARNGAGTALVRVPEHSGNVALSVNPEGRLSGTVLVTYNGEEQDPNGILDAWTRVDLSGSYAMSESVELFARVENLFDEQYQQVLGYGTPGLSGFLGARLKF